MNKMKMIAAVMTTLLVTHDGKKMLTIVGRVAKATTAKVKDHVDDNG